MYVRSKITFGYGVTDNKTLVVGLPLMGRYSYSQAGANYFLAIK